MKKPQRKRIRVDELGIYAQAQRKLVENWAQKLADEFDDGAVGSFIISERNGHYYIIDGQHRRAAMLIIGRGSSTVDCLVYKDLSPSQEAALFLKHNNTKIVTAVDKFLVRLTAKEENAVQIKKILDSRGIRIARCSQKEGVTNAVGALDKIYLGKACPGKSALEGSSLLEVTLDCLLEAWGDDHTALTSGVLTGVAAFLSRYWNEIDPKRFVERMKKYKGGASGLIRDAKALRDIRRISPVGSYAGMLVDMYNTGLRNNNHLEDWGR